MIDKSTDLVEFDALRPKLRALLELHRSAETEEARAALMAMFEEAFLATAWHVAQDLLENGWSPGFVSGETARGRARLRVIGGSDAA